MATKMTLKELGELFHWSAVPRLNEEDGWDQIEIFGSSCVETSHRCRIDPRFIHEASYAVRRFGGGELAEHLAAAVKVAGANGTPYGLLLEEGILFAYLDRPGDEPSAEIVNAEVVAPTPALPTPLIQFFAEIWQRRASHAQEVANALQAELTTRHERSL